MFSLCFPVHLWNQFTIIFCQLGTAQKKIKCETKENRQTKSVQSCGSVRKKINWSNGYVQVGHKRVKIAISSDFRDSVKWSIAENSFVVYTIRSHFTLVLSDNHVFINTRNATNKRSYNVLISVRGYLKFARAHHTHDLSWCNIPISMSRSLNFIWTWTNFWAK